MGIKSLYKVEGINKEQYVDWLLNVHYAKRVPIIKYAFGLLDSNNKIVGACTFGPQIAIHYNNCNYIFSEIRMQLLELNRLVVEPGLPKNCLSFFVSESIKKLPECCIISYADIGYGHHGYIYQATNWLYTGAVQAHSKSFFINGKEVHPRTLAQSTTHQQRQLINTKETSFKHRYFYFNANNKMKNRMKKQFLFDVLPYPKGENLNYEIKSTPINIKSNLFNL